MGSQPPTYERHVDQDGVTHIQKKRTGSGTWIVGLALGFTVLCIALSLWLIFPSDPEASTPAVPPVRMVRNTATPATPSSVPRSTAPRPSTPAVAPVGPPQPGAEPPPATPEDSASSEPAEGIHLYRPGTSPLKQGLVVPEGFKLPEGYVRHYQTTDNGEGLKPILMFHEDFTPKDASGKPIEIPSNRVVPPELAPAGMPIEVLELPEGPEGVEPIP